VLLGAPSSDKEAGCLGVFALEQAGPFLLAPGEGAGATLRFSPQDARSVGGVLGRSRPLRRRGLC
jgi:hypothetical protein